MENNDLNVENLNNMSQSNTNMEQPVNNKQMTIEEKQYNYLKDLNKRLVLFKVSSDSSKNEKIK